MKYYKFISLNIVFLINCIYFYFCYFKKYFTYLDFTYDFSLFLLCLFFVAEFFIKRKSTDNNLQNNKFTIIYYSFFILSFIALSLLDNSVLYFKNILNGKYLILLLFLIPYFHKNRNYKSIILFSCIGYLTLIFGIISAFVLFNIIPLLNNVEQIYTSLGIIYIILMAIKYIGLTSVILSFGEYLLNKKFKYNYPSKIPEPIIVIGILLYFVIFYFVH